MPSKAIRSAASHKRGVASGILVKKGATPAVRAMLATTNVILITKPVTKYVCNAARFLEISRMRTPPIPISENIAKKAARLVAYENTP
jgi:hypothetical protein